MLVLLAGMVVNFDCASLAEIKQVLDLGIDPGRIIFAHPRKAPSALDVAARRGIRWTTFNNADELEKIQRVSPKMELLLRIYAQDDQAKVILGGKFGAPMDATWRGIPWVWRVYARQGMSLFPFGIALSYKPVWKCWLTISPI